MRTPKQLRWDGRSWRSATSAIPLYTLAAWLLAIPGPVIAAGIVTTRTEASLRSAMAGGGTVTFACDGTFTLANTISNSLDTVLDGTGHQITISGSNTVRVFFVNTNVSFTLLNLTVANGRSTNGAGIFNAGGTVTLLGDVFQTNIAYWDGGSLPPIGGGAIFNQFGTACAANCTFVANEVASAPQETYPPLPSFGGGAIWNEGGHLVLQACVFTGNQALGCENANYLLNPGGDAFGGAVLNTGTNVIDLCSFSQNSTVGGTSGGSAWGGAICNEGSLTVARSSFINNWAVGADGGCYDTGVWGGAAEGAAICNFGMLLLQSTTLAENGASGGWGEPGFDCGIELQDDPGGPGGFGGSAAGGLFNLGTATLINDTIALNSAFGGNGGQGGQGGPSKMYSYGGAGGNGGSGCGGIAGLSNLLQMANCTVASNSASAGMGGQGGCAYGKPWWQTGPSGTNGVPVGGVNALSCVFASTLLAGNVPLNFAGTNIDASCNLSSDASCTFTNTGSRTNTNPLLGPLANNGGPTLTMALLPGSPAIDAGSAIGAPATDQRGILRPQGPGVDIGAYEYQYIPVFNRQPIQAGAQWQFQVSGLWLNQSYTLQVSSNLVTWSEVASGTAPTNGCFEVIDPGPGPCPRRFYRLSANTP